MPIMDAPCGEGCGWSAAIVAMLSFGTFGVPIKSETCRRLAIDPLVFQSYKTVVCFISSFVVLTAMGHPLKFTPWGIVSALFWVPGGVGTVAAVQLAGLAVAVAVGNSLIALVSFCWGIFFFREPIHSREMACLAVMMMICGFTGMSYYSTRDTNETVKHHNIPSNSDKSWTPNREGGQGKNHNYEFDQNPPKAIATSPSSNESIELIEEARRQHVLARDIHDFETKTSENKHANDQHLASDKINHPNTIMNSSNTKQGANGADEKEDETNDSNSLGAGLRHRHHQSHTLQHHSNQMTNEFLSPEKEHASLALDPFSSSSPLVTPGSNQDLHSAKYVIPTTIHESQQQSVPSFFYFVPQHRHQQSTVATTANNSACAPSPNPNDAFLIIGRRHTLSRRQVGIALAVFNGCWGGSIMVPMKFCPDAQITNGIGYVWSFSIGAMLVTAGVWIFRYLWLLTGTIGEDDTYSAMNSDNINHDDDVDTIPRASSKRRLFYKAFQALPSLHLAEMWRLGGLSGLLWSIGNLFSILSVDFLGEGVGYCVCQASMLVSGLWGILYFKEVTGAANITKWFLSALFTVAGILLLSYEHHAT